MNPFGAGLDFRGVTTLIVGRLWIKSYIYEKRGITAFSGYFSYMFPGIGKNYLGKLLVQIFFLMMGRDGGSHGKNGSVLNFQTKGGIVVDPGFKALDKMGHVVVIKKFPAVGHGDR
jgi:hypothetical protein